MRMGWRFSASATGRRNRQPSDAAAATARRAVGMEVQRAVVSPTRGARPNTRAPYVNYSWLARAVHTGLLEAAVAGQVVVVSAPPAPNAEHVPTPAQASARLRSSTL